MPTVSILGLSMLLQYVAAALAFRLRHETSNRAWYLVSLAILLMAVRRSITLTRYLVDHAALPDPWAETVALLISSLMVAGLLAMRPLFRSMTQSSERIRKSEEHLRSLIANASDVITVVDRDGTITYESPAAERVFGFAASERRGTSIYAALHPDDRTLARRALSGGFRRPGTQRSVTLRMRTADGAWRVIEATGWVRPNPEGQLLAIVNSRDVTARRAAETIATRLGRLLDRSLNEIYLFDPDTLFFEFVNEGARKNLGYEMSELRNLTPLDLKTEYTPESFAALVAPLREGRRGRIRFQTSHRRKDGSAYPVEVDLQLMEWKTAPIFAAIILDRSEQASAERERRRLEAQLRRAQRLESVGTLAGGIAHDFNNILTPLLGYLDLARAGLPPEIGAGRHLEQAAQAADRARALVQRILTFSRELEQDRRPIALGVVVGEALDLLRSSLPATIEIRPSLGDVPSMVRADPTQIHQIVLNLCTNAAHAMGNAGVLDVRLEACEVDAALPRVHPRLQAGSYIKLTFTDTGCGMDAVTQDRIFEPFFTTKPTQDSSGLGLSVVHGIVRTHGGEITVESRPGEGARFSIYLPRIDAAIEGHPYPEPPVPRGSARVLFVDDEDPITQLGREMLETLGYRVTLAHDGPSALAVMRGAPAAIDLVVTDQTMPGMTGIELSGELLRVRPDLPILLTTGFSEGVTRERVRRLGIRDLLMKPYGRRDLGLAVDAVLREAASSVASGAAEVRGAFDEA